MAAKCLYRNGLSIVITGFNGLLLSIETIVLFSACLAKKSEEATPISSPAFQSTFYINVIFVAPASAVVSSIVHAGSLGGPCISSVQYLHAITLFP